MSLLSSWIRLDDYKDLSPKQLEHLKSMKESVKGYVGQYRSADALLSSEDYPALAKQLSTHVKLILELSAEPKDLVKNLESMTKLIAKLNSDHSLGSLGYMYDFALNSVIPSYLSLALKHRVNLDTILDTIFAAINPNKYELQSSSTLALLLALLKHSGVDTGAISLTEAASVVDRQQLESNVGSLFNGPKTSSIF